MSSGADTIWNHLRDAGLHVLGAVVACGPAFLASTPTWLAVAWCVVCGGFWFAREWAQAGDDAGGRNPISQWHHWKHVEWIAPLVAALGIAGWRLL